MKTSEDKLDEALRAALKRKFDDFEDQPNPSSYNFIRARLKQPRNYKYLFLTIFFLVVFVAGIKIDQHLMTRKSEDKKLHVQTNKAVSSRIVAATDRIEKVGDLKKQELAARDDVAYHAAAGSVMPSGEGKRYKARKTQKILPSELTQLQVNWSPQISFQKITEETIERQEHEKPGTTLGTTDADSQDPAVGGSSEVLGHPIITLNVSQIGPGQFKPVSMSLPAVMVSEKSQTRHAIHANPQKVSWLFNIASLKTYQILTVPKSVDQNFQNFMFPSVFSLESLGYKVSAGLEKKGFQLLLNYSTFRQTYSYEIAGDEYVVETVGRKDYKIVRPGTIVNENRKLNLLGIGLTKQLHWGRSPFRKYYASAGLEYSHTLNTGPGIGWVNASFGRQFAVNRTALLHVGPYAEFSPLKVSGTTDPFYSQPYRVGISLGMKLIRP